MSYHVKRITCCHGQALTAISRALRLSLTNTDHHTPSNINHGTGYAMTDEQDNIEIELSDADTVVKADTSARSSVLEAQKYEEFQKPPEIS